MELKDRYALGPDEVFHARGPVAVGARDPGPRRRLVEPVSHAEVERAGEDRDALRLRVRVRRDAIAVGELEPEAERLILARFPSSTAILAPFGRVPRC